MPVYDLQIRPGVKREGTNLSNEGFWYDSDKVRFRSGYPEKIGGWAPYSFDSYNGVARALYNWVSLDGSVKLGLGTNTKLYISKDQLLFDITPVRRTITRSNPFAFVNGSTTVTITDAGHGAAATDFVIVSAVAGALNGVPAADLNKEHQVISVIDANTYTITVNTPANSTGTPAAANISLTYLYASGNAVTSGGPGWGTGTWSRGPWSSTVSVYPTTPLRLWSLTNYGQDFVACIRNGPIFYWVETDAYPNPPRAVDLTTLANSAPTTATGVMVSESRHLIAFGAVPYADTVQDRLLVRWSNQEDYTDWTPTPTNSSGEYRLWIGGEIVAWVQTRQEILVWTDKALFSMQFQGPPNTFSFTLIANNVSILGPNAVTVVGNSVFWMGVDKFYTYSGQVQTLPSDVRSYVFDALNYAQRLQVFSGSIERYNEVWWWYVDNDSTYPNRYVAYNFVENTWVIGTMDRTAWIDSGVSSNPIATSNGLLYFHEVGVDAVGISSDEAISAYIESADTDIDAGDDFMYIRRFIPDLEFTNSTTDDPELTVTIKTRTNAGTNYRQTNSTPIVQTATAPIRQFTEQVWLRMRGRQAAVRFESDALGVQWQLGRVRLDAKQDGKK